MKRANCIGKVGKLPTPKGLQMFWDTGKTITPVQLAEGLALQHAYFNAKGRAQEMARDKIVKFTTEIANQANVFPVGGADLVGLADDGRILVTEPYYEEKEDRPAPL